MASRNSYHGKLPAARSIRQWQDMFQNIFGRWCRIHTTPQNLVLRFGIGLGQLAEAIRVDRPTSDGPLADLGMRIFVLANYLEIDLSRATAYKFPGRCLRCGESTQCICKPVPKAKRPVAMLPEGLLLRPLSDWHAFLAGLYGEKNRAVGREKVLLRLFRENKEIAEAILDGDDDGMQEECADILAWWIGYCTVEGVPSVADLLWKYFPDVCCQCGSAPCARTPDCPKF